MLKVVEAFSGIGSQHRALENLKIKYGYEYKIINTIEWDINAIYAYDLIHNGPQINNPYNNIPREEILTRLFSYTLSLDGKDPIKESQLMRFSDDALRQLLFAIKRTKNLVSIKDVNSDNISEDIDLLTYSFPCQDLSMSGFFHGDKGGIDRDANNSSSMLWEVERILMDINESQKNLPKFLLMENVSSITSRKHIDNFNDWIDSLTKLGYSSHYGSLNSENFNIPQKRKRTFMISVYHGNNIELKSQVEDYFKINIDFDDYLKHKINDNKILKSILKTDYSIEKYLNEAIEQVPNDTESRRRIFENNLKIIDKDNKVSNFVRTITTKQDRHPNSGTISIDRKVLGLDNSKSNYRFLTPRETMLLMGFKEQDFEVLINNNIEISKYRRVFNNTRIYKMAGNSIVVNVIEEIFKIIYDIRKLIKD